MNFDSLRALCSFKETQCKTNGNTCSAIFVISSEFLETLFYLCRSDKCFFRCKILRIEWINNFARHASVWLGSEFQFVHRTRAIFEVFEKRTRSCFFQLSCTGNRTIIQKIKQITKDKTNQQILLLTYKCMNDMTPIYLIDLLRSYIYRNETCKISLYELIRSWTI